MAANRNGIRWGICHFERPEKVPNGYHCPEGENEYAGRYGSFRQKVDPHWHLPRQYFYNHSIHDPYQHADLFVVVSNPLDRMIRLYESAMAQTQAFMGKTLTKEHVNLARAHL